MRVCCGLTAHLELARRPDLYGTPVIVGRWDEHVVAASEETSAFGVLHGMALRQAEHLCPQATFVLPDEEAVVRIRELIAAALYDLAPVVEVRDEGIAWLDLSGVLLARGLEPDQLDAWRPPLFTSAHRQFGEPVEDREALLFVARALCGDLADELGLRGAGAKHVRVRLIFDSTESEKRESIVRHPLSSATELFGLIGSWIKEWQPRAPIAELWIDLPVLEAAGRRQLRLWAGGDGSSEEVTAALERLQERFGDVIWQPLPA